MNTDLTSELERSVQCAEVQAKGTAEDEAASEHTSTLKGPGDPGHQEPGE